MAKWQGTIEAAEPDVERILAEEHEEAALRRAEMEANKAAVRRCGAVYPIWPHVCVGDVSLHHAMWLVVVCAGHVRWHAESDFMWHSWHEH
jgi:hypothetical protein